MKKIYTLLFSVVTLGLQAQSLTTANFPGNTIVGFDTDPALVASFDIVNNSANAIDVRVTKTDLNVVAGTDNVFCWGGNCFPPGTITYPLTVSLGPGQQTNNIDRFIGDYYPNNIAGTSTIRYCFYDDNNSMDQTCVDITYDALFTSVANQLKLSSYLGGSTFISRKKMNSFNYRLVDAKNATINLVNMLGNTVKTYNVSSQQGVVLMNAGDLKSGVYFMTLNVNGKRVANKKVIVE
ncbi:MAG: T9SS type A sorting domain-containing protein [Bacteroidetes bacterium]|nr:T9SS type A sorting domain-containing protein [Bacteroidota bacterium]